MANWVPVDQNRFMTLHNEKIGGVETQVVSSMFDLPTALRANYDDKKRTLVIDFKYLGEEPAEKVIRQGSPIVIEFAVTRSGRLRQITVPFPRGLEADARDGTLRNIVEAVLGALVNLAFSNIKWVRAENVEVARATIRENGQSLFSTLVPSPAKSLGQEAW
jgi:hypothetical protein